MSKILQTTIVAALAALTINHAFGQTPGPRRHAVINCVKVKDGKNAEFRAYLNDVTAKLYKSRVDTGEVATYIVAAAVSPVGRAARCDYHLVATYNGIPAEVNAPGKLDADLKRAGLNMTAEQLAARRDSLSTLVSRETWRTREMVGGGAQKGGYGRVNYFKIHQGMTADFVAAEESGWKPYAEERNKQNAGHTWSFHTLVMPGGENLPYNAMTVDGFPSWESLMNSGSGRAIWNKVHPNLDSTAHFDRVNSISDRPFTDVVRIVDVIRK
ncbi:MAG: hypothetical protein JNL98_30095 [Bryobacterales bacterium]|nr:hypothetical protein [Bryobacterales bacterium]